MEFQRNSDLEIFVGCVPYTMQKHHLIAHFNNYGRIGLVVLPRKECSGKGKGFCIVHCEDSVTFNNILSNEHWLAGRKLTVEAMLTPQQIELKKQELNERRIVIRNIPLDWNEDTLYGVLRAYGPLERVTLNPRTRTSHLSQTGLSARATFLRVQDADFCIRCPHLREFKLKVFNNRVERMIKRATDEVRHCSELNGEHYPYSEPLHYCPLEEMNAIQYHQSSKITSYRAQVTLNSYKHNPDQEERIQEYHKKKIRQTKSRNQRNDEKRRIEDPKLPSCNNYYGQNSRIDGISFLLINRMQNKEIGEVKSFDSQIIYNPPLILRQQPPTDIWSVFRNVELNHCEKNILLNKQDKRDSESLKQNQDSLVTSSTSNYHSESANIAQK